MKPILFRCPTTGELVQHRVPVQRAPDAGEWEMVTCNACSRTHLVNQDGRVAGEKRQQAL